MYFTKSSGNPQIPQFIKLDKNFEPKTEHTCQPDNKNGFDLRI